MHSRRWLVVSVALIVMAVAVMAGTMIMDSPERNSTNWYFLGMVLALAGMFAGLWSGRRKASDREGDAAP